MAESETNLAELVRSYLDDQEVGLRPGDPDEPLLNTWGYGVELGPLDPAAVVAALRDVADTLRARLATSSGPGTFYAWYDAQAGQLRCSLASANEDELPFRKPYMTTSDSSLVVALVAMDPSPGTIPLDDLREITGTETWEDPPTTPTLVWTTRVA